VQKVITYENLRDFAYSNDKICAMPVKGIALYFFGCGNQPFFDEDTPMGLELAREGIILLIPYYNPWSWMNRQAFDYTGEILSVVKGKYSLPDDIPVVSSGLSMGGLSALVYARDAKPAPVACVLNCPVCDLVYYSESRHGVYRTLYSAFYSACEEGTLEDAFKKVSPLHSLDALPKIPYFVFQCENDTNVLKEAHSDRFAAEMRRLGHGITYHTIPGREHCDLPDDMMNLFTGYIKDAILC